MNDTSADTEAVVDVDVFFFLFFFLGGGGPLGSPSGEKRSRSMASSGKPLGHSSTDLCPGSKNYTPERDAGGTRDHFGNGRQCSPRRTLQRRPP